VRRAAHVSRRTCVGCGARAPQATLLRFGGTMDGGLARKRGLAHTGRSAYLHRRVECWERFAARKGPVRSLGRAVDKPTRAAFVQELKQAEPSAMV